MRLLWEHSLKETGHSWTRLNQALRSTLKSLINAGVEFHEDDFAIIHEEMRPGYWFGERGEEEFYRLAVDAGNLSACKAVEKSLGFDAFILYGKRLYVGADVVIEGVKYEITSHSGKDAFNLVRRYRDPKFSNRVAGLGKLTRQMIKEMNAARRKEKKLAATSNEEGTDR